MKTQAHNPIKEAGKEKEDLPGYPIYPASEDIYSHDQKIADVSVERDENPKENASKLPADHVDSGSLDEGLDIPGSELDDEQENIGAEDDENNYYSLGGENHEDLEEGNDDLR